MKGHTSPIIGEGEMAELIRAFDWGSTPLGPVRDWSDTLVTTVNLLLASRHPMFLWWGPDLIQFYNDGYRPSLRADKHPSAVGQRGRECWPEIWHIIGAQIDAVMGAGISTWNTNQLVPINRDGKLEEVFWTYSYSPVRDKGGDVQGTLVVCTETTDQVLSERRLRTLLGISGNLPVGDFAPQSSFANILIRSLETNPADIPFALLYLLKNGEVLVAGKTESAEKLTASTLWPLDDVLSSQTALFVSEIDRHCGIVHCAPWPEPVTRAFVLPLLTTGPSVRAVLVLGISPRLPFDDRYQTFLQLVGTRITSLLQGEVHQLELTQAANRFRQLAEADPFGMLIGDLRGGLRYANSTLLKTLGYSEEDVASGRLRWDSITPPEYAEADCRAVEQLRDLGRCQVYEKAYVAKDGRHVPILIGASVINTGGSDPEVAAFVTDLTPLKVAQDALKRANEELEKKVAERTLSLEAEISERRRAEQNLRELTGRLLQAQDDERRHMARELHDHAGQTLAALGMNLSALRRAVESQDAKIVRLTEESLDMSDALSKEVRTLSYLLHPPLLDEVGLRSAIQWYVKGFSERSGINVEFDIQEKVERLPRDLELVIFRVMQESLTNIHRHAASASARISLSLLPTFVLLEVADQGRGIAIDKLAQMKTAQAGVGVRGMEERVRQFGGELRITSDTQGTKVAAKIPLSR
jgi:PAS domain S-box-containing protein